MNCFKVCFALGACLLVFLVTPAAMADEPRNRSAFEAGRPARRFELARLHAHTSMPFGLRLPKILSFGSSPAPATSTRGISDVPRPTECRTHCAEGPVTDRTRATTSAILAGVGGVAVVTGVVLTIIKPRQSEQPGLAPTFRMKLSGQRAVASADWSF